MHKFAFTKIIPWAAGGAGLAALENRFVGENLPEELQNVNLGLGGLSGAAIGGIIEKHPQVAAAIAAALPVKSMGLFGIGAMDRFRQAQQNLVDTNLETAKINQSTARLTADNEGGRKAMALAFLIPALLGGGGLAYYAWNRRKKDQQDNRFRTVDSKGRPSGRSRIRIDVPATALPSDFYKSLVNVDDNPRAFTRVQEQRSDIDPETAQSVERAKQAAATPLNDAAKAFMTKRAAAEEQFSFPRALGNLAAELTGAPSAWRSVNELPKSFNSMSEGDLGNATRYGLSGLGNAALGVVGGRTVMLPIIGSLLGRGRLRSMMRQVPGRPRGSTAGSPILGQFPGLGRKLWQRAYGNKMDDTLRFRGLTQADALGKPKQVLETQEQARKRMGLGMRGAEDRRLDIKNRYDRNRYAWQRPATPAPSNTAAFAAAKMKGLTPGSPEHVQWQRWAESQARREAAAAPGLGSKAKNFFLREPVHPSVTGPGRALTSGPRYLANRGLNAAYWTRQWTRRNPNATLLIGASPFAAQGVEQDKWKDKQHQAELKKSLPAVFQNGTPVSSSLAMLSDAVTGQHSNSNIVPQLAGAARDPWTMFR